MKRKLSVLLILAVTGSLILNSCKKKEDPPVLPTLTTDIVTSITANSGISGGNITFDGGATVTSRGVCWDTINNPTIVKSKTIDGTGKGSFTSNLTGLLEGKTYHVRAYATNLAGTAYGDDKSFTTLARPTLSTKDISAVTLSAANSGGNISSDGGASITARGICWSTSGLPTLSDPHTVDGEGTGSFTSSIQSLDEGTTYYVRAYATNGVGTGYGNQLRFTTSLHDLDGNLYNTLNLGTQIWLKENLKVIHYKNGDAIQNIADGSSWDTLTRGAWCLYENDNKYDSIYGKLYNGYTVLDPRGVCPAGWHVPSSIDFEQLQNYIGGLMGGGKMKETGFLHWTSPNTDATNETGFTGRPAGHRSKHVWGTDGFEEIGLSTGFWQSNITSEISYNWALLNYNSVFIKNSYTYPGVNALIFGYSVRCVKD